MRLIRIFLVSFLAQCSPNGGLHIEETITLVETSYIDFSILPLVPPDRNAVLNSNKVLIRDSIKLKQIRGILSELTSANCESKFTKNVYLISTIHFEGSDKLMIYSDKFHYSIDGKCYSNSNVLNELLMN